MRDHFVGKVLTNIQLASDRKAIRFSFDDGTEIIGKCDGDCCSDTWIAHVEPPTSYPANIIDVGDIPLLDDTDDDYEVTRHYGFKLVTSMGHAVVEYRNSSNGYYGGEMNWPWGSYYYGGVYGQNVSTMEWMDELPSDAA